MFNIININPTFSLSKASEDIFRSSWGYFCLFVNTYGINWSHNDAEKQLILITGKTSHCFQPVLLIVGSFQADLCPGVCEVLVTRCGPEQSWLLPSVASCDLFSKKRRAGGEAVIKRMVKRLRYDTSACLGVQCLLYALTYDLEGGVITVEKMSQGD